MLLKTQPLKRLRLLKTFITNESFDTILSTILAMGRHRESGYVCLTNTHMLIEAYNDPSFCDVVNEAAIAAPDGKPLSIAMNWLYRTGQEQVAGMDLMLGILREAEKNQLSVFFWAPPTMS
jgi:N-acetylglucosaminyldiphosphoundecaprenol N-acetyl-beta-D-mannosaminyltransferase